MIAFLVQRRKLLIGGFFLLLLLAGFMAFWDVGISWDEKTQYALGRNVYGAVLKGAEWPTDPGRRFHGPFFEFILYSLGKMYPFPDAKAIFQMRHFVNFLSFYLGVFFFYLLAARHFRSTLWGLLGALFLALSPRIFGHAFFNSRDIPTLTLFIISMFTLVRFLDRKTMVNVLLHALACAILMSVRMTGLLMPAFTFLFLFVDAAREFKEEGRVSVPRYALLGFTFLVAWCLLMIAFWPLLWEQPIQNFLDAFENMSTKSPGGFYFGERYITNPWHWIPVWIAISTPILYTVFFLCGFVVNGVRIVRDSLFFLFHRRSEVLFLLWFFLPILSVGVLGAGIFDEWRHVYFIYPAFLLIALTGLRWILDDLLPRLSAKFQRFGQGLLAGVCALSVLWTIVWMVWAHPFQYVYFSLPRSLVEGQFELDYWGLSYRQALEYVLANDSDPVIPIVVTGSPGYSNLNVLTPDQRSRIRFVGPMISAKYVIDNFRWKDYHRTLPAADMVHSITVAGMEIAAVYKNPLYDPAIAATLPSMPTKEVLFVFPASFLGSKASEAPGGSAWIVF